MSAGDPIRLEERIASLRRRNRGLVDHLKRVQWDLARAQGNVERLVRLVDKAQREHEARRDS